LADAAFAVPSNAATVNGVAISQQQLNSDLTAIGASPEYQCFLNAQEAVGTGGQSGLPAIDGAGPGEASGARPSVTTDFGATYLDTAIGHQLILELAAQKHLVVTPQEISAAHSSLLNQITAYTQEVSGSKFACGSVTASAVLATMPSSFVNENVRFDATVGVFEESASGVGSSTADLQRYFEAHASEFDKACFTVAQYSSQADAAAAVAQVAAGTPFAQVASAAGGGSGGCDILYGVAAEFPAGTNLQSLALNTVSSPIAENGEYLVLEITKRTPTPFATARPEVESAVQNAGATKARTEVDAAEKAADVWVNARYGQWEPAQAEILPPTAPLGVDVLDASANGAATDTSPAATSATGQTP